MKCIDLQLHSIVNYTGNLSFNQHWMIFLELEINEKDIVKTFRIAKKMKEASVTEFVEAGMPKNVAETIYTYLADKKTL